MELKKPGVPEEIPEKLETAPPAPPHKDYRITAGLAILVVAASFWGWWIFQNRSLRSPRPKKAPTVSSLPTPTPTPTPQQIYRGRATYRVSQGSKVGPRITEVTFDPHDPKKAEVQTVDVKVAHTQPVSSVSIHLYTDQQEKDLVLKLVSGTAQNGTWQTAWNVDNTVLYRYMYTITAQAADGASKVDVTLRS